MKTFNEWLTETGMDVSVDKSPIARLHGKRPHPDEEPEGEGPEGDEDLEGDDDEEEPEGDEPEGDDDLEEPEGDEEEPEGDEPPPPPAKKAKKFDFSSLGQ